jgi:hypothetical protein
MRRWRKLEGTDPTAYELIMKCQTLQKRLIKRTEQVVDKDLQLQQKEKLYTELKLILSRQPGPELAQQLSTYQVTLTFPPASLSASPVHFFLAILYPWA